MSLNACEQRIYDYLAARPEEKRHWQTKVRSAAAGSGDGYAAAARLELDLWRYHEELCAALASFRSNAGREPLRRTSMRNLSELLLRLWTEPKPKSKAAARGGSEPPDAQNIA